MSRVRRPRRRSSSQVIVTRTDRTNSQTVQGYDAYGDAYLISDCMHGCSLAVLVSHLTRSPCSGPATERGESLILNFLIPWSNCQGCTGLLNYSTYVTRSLAHSHSHPLDDYCTPSFTVSALSAKLSIALSKLFIRMLLLRDPLGRNSIRVKKRRPDTTYLRVPRPRRCAAAIAQHCDVFWWQNAETRDCLPCLMSHNSPIKRTRSHDLWE
jgi:hypothetical protein